MLPVIALFKDQCAQKDHKDGADRASAYLYHMFEKRINAITESWIKRFWGCEHDMSHPDIDIAGLRMSFKITDQRFIYSLASTFGLKNVISKTFFNTLSFKRKVIWKAFVQANSYYSAESAKGDGMPTSELMDQKTKETKLYFPKDDLFTLFLIINRLHTIKMNSNFVVLEQKSDPAGQVLNLILSSSVAFNQFLRCFALISPSEKNRSDDVSPLSSMVPSSASKDTSESYALHEDPDHVDEDENDDSEEDDETEAKFLFSFIVTGFLQKSQS